MGDPIRFRKTYLTPHNPWQTQRVADERKLLKEYGLRSKTELYKVEAQLRKYRRLARQLVGSTEKGAEGKKKILIDKLVNLGVLQKGAKLDDVLALEVRDFLERRIQTLVYKKGFATTPFDARKLIVHGHVSYLNHVHTSPNTFVGSDAEEQVAYIGPQRVREITDKESKEPPILSDKSKTEEMEVE